MFARHTGVIVQSVVINAVIEIVIAIVGFDGNIVSGIGRK